MDTRVNGYVEVEYCKAWNIVKCGILYWFSFPLPSLSGLTGESSIIKIPTFLTNN